MTSPDRLIERGSDNLILMYITKIENHFVELGKTTQEDNKYFSHSNKYILGNDITHTLEVNQGTTISGINKKRMVYSTKELFNEMSFSTEINDQEIYNLEIKNKKFKTLEIPPIEDSIKEKIVKDLSEIRNSINQHPYYPNGEKLMEQSALIISKCTKPAEIKYSIEYTDLYNAGFFKKNSLTKEILFLNTQEGTNNFKMTVNFLVNGIKKDENEKDVLLCPKDTIILKTEYNFDGTYLNIEKKEDKFNISDIEAKDLEEKFPHYKFFINYMKKIHELYDLYNYPNSNSHKTLVGKALSFINKALVL